MRKIRVSKRRYADMASEMFDSVVKSIMPKIRSVNAPDPSKRYIRASSNAVCRALRRDLPAASKEVFDDICDSVELLLRVTWLKRRDELIMQYNDFVPRTMSKERVKTTFAQAPSWLDEDLEEIETKVRRKSLDSSTPVDKAEILEQQAFEIGVAGPQEISLLKNLHVLADHANFDRLGDDWIDKALSNPDRDGVCLKPVNRSDFTTLQIWVRGRSEGSKITTRQGLEKRLRDAYDLEIRAKDVDRETRFERVLAAVRRKGDPYMHLMLFEHVPATQIELVFPDIEVAMRLKDKILIGVLGGIGGLVVACKTAAVAMIGAQTNIYGLALAGSVCAGVCFQTWVQFHMKRTQFNHTITKHLFQRKLAQNMITIESLIHETIEQETRELIIGLALLQQNDQDNAITSKILKNQAESFLKKQFNISTCQFDIDDCIDKLADLNLLEKDSSFESLKAVPLETARERIKHRTRTEFAFSS